MLSLLAMSASAGSAFSLATTRGTLLHATWRPARALPISMGTWDESDVKIMPVPLPDAIEDLLSDDTDRELTQIMWSAFVKCYASEDDAIAACQRSSVSIMHYLNRPSNIVGTFRYLEEELGTEGARDVIMKNPGVLSCSPYAIKQEPIENVVKAAEAIDSIESLPPIVKQFAGPVTFVTLSSLLYLRLQACADGACVQ